MTEEELRKLAQEWLDDTIPGHITAPTDGYVIRLTALLTRVATEAVAKVVAANMPPRRFGSLQEEVDALRRDVAELQVTKHNLITRLGEATHEGRAVALVEGGCK